MVSIKKRLEQIENAVLVLAGGGAGFAAGRMGTGTAARVAVQSPVVRAALAGYTYGEIREELNQRDREAAAQEFGPTAGELIGLAQRTQALPVPLGQAAVAGTKLGKAVRKKTVSKFNKAVSAGMKQVRASTSNGKKGSIKDAKKAFATVTKTVSKIRKGGKVAKKGLLRKIGLAAKKVLK